MLCIVLYVLLSGQLPREDAVCQRDGEYGLMVSADDPNLLDKVSQGADKGEATVEYWTYMLIVWLSF